MGLTCNKLQLPLLRVLFGFLDNKCFWHRTGSTTLQHLKNMGKMIGWQYDQLYTEWSRHWIHDLLVGLIYCWPYNIQTKNNLLLHLSGITQCNPTRTPRIVLCALAVDLSLVLSRCLPSGVHFLVAWHFYCLNVIEQYYHTIHARVITPRLYFLGLVRR